MPEEPPDPCSSGEYLKNKLKSMPLLGNKSINDLLPPGGLGGVIAPELPKPPGLPGPGTFPTGGEIMGGIKDGIKDKLSDLHPDKIIAGVKAGAKDRLRTGLTDALNEKVSDILGPVKDGIGNRILHQVKGNLLMGALDEVANIAIGAPNIFDPCGKKAKEKTAEKVAKAADIGKSASANNDMNKAIGSALKLPENSTNAMKKKFQSPVDIPTGAIPPFGASTNPLDTLKAKTEQAEAVAKVTADATKIVVKKTEEKIEKESIAEAAEETEPFSPVQPGGSKTYRFYMNRLEEARDTKFSDLSKPDKIDYLKNFHSMAVVHAEDGWIDEKGIKLAYGLVDRTIIGGKIVKRYQMPGEDTPKEYYIGWVYITQWEHFVQSINGINQSVNMTNIFDSMILKPTLSYWKGDSNDPRFGLEKNFDSINSKNLWGTQQLGNFVYTSKEDCAVALIDLILGDNILNSLI